MIQISEDFALPIRLELERDEAVGLVAAIDALNEKVAGNAELMAALGLTAETLELADAAGAKVLMRL